MLKKVCFPVLTAGYPCLLDPRTVSWFLDSSIGLSNPRITLLCNPKFFKLQLHHCSPSFLHNIKYQMQRQHSHCTPCSCSFHSGIQTPWFWFVLEHFTRHSLFTKQKKPNPRNSRKTQLNPTNRKNCKNHHSTDQLKSQQASTQCKLWQALEFQWTDGNVSLPKIFFLCFVANFVGTAVRWWYLPSCFSEYIPKKLTSSKSSPLSFSSACSDTWLIVRNCSLQIKNYYVFSLIVTWLKISLHIQNRLFTPCESNSRLYFS